MEQSPSLATRAALAALDAHIGPSGSPDEEIALAAAGTALFWACVLDEQLERTPGYKSRRNSDYAGRLLPGLKLGRNALAHGATVIAMPALARTWPAIWPLVWKGASWADYATVRSGLTREPNDHGRSIWVDRIAGQNVPGTLAVVYDWLAAEATGRARSDP